MVQYHSAIWNFGHGMFFGLELSNKLQLSLWDPEPVRPVLTTHGLKTSQSGSDGVFFVALVSVVKMFL